MRGVISFLLILNLGISNAQGDTSFYQYVKELETIFDQTNYTPVEFRDTSLHVIKAISTRQRNGTVVNRSTYLEKQKELSSRSPIVVLVVYMDSNNVPKVISNAVT